MARTKSTAHLPSLEAEPHAGVKARLELVNSQTPTEKLPSRELLLERYQMMLMIRRFEEKAGQLYGMGQIGGFCHLYIGQEAVVVGIQAGLVPGDSVITSYRDHGHMIACGMDPKGVMAELTGRATGYSRGKGGSMHMFSREKGFFGGHGIVGAQVPIGSGLAFAHFYRREPKVCVSYYGDGAANQGQIAEAMNMASLWKLPQIFVIENNRYGMGTATSRAAAGTELWKRGQGYGIPGCSVDGMDVVAVEEAARKAITAARNGEGPYVLEMQTYRYRGHSMSDPAKYRSKDEVTEMREKHDPIDLVARLLQNDWKVTEAELKAIDTEIKAICAEAAEFATTSPEPDPSELWTDVIVGA
ncbi:MAG: pyruvate dehydrogenase (acetyl-transferring) E1 component subunit alpha [Alphaproteobacteria bacterium]|nr:pyruvate dehydrogenase (acetyl-transferring) E1 component subunit alpha [Alphaproteobacteria bacterium]